MHLNVCSLLAANRLESFKLQVESSNVDIFCVSETWLTEAVPGGLTNVKGYVTHRLDRRWNDNGDPGNCKRGGGLLCYSKLALNSSDSKYEHLNCSTRDIELQWISVDIKNLRPIVILNVYRPPQGDHKKACNLLNDSIAKAHLKNNTEIYVLGDFNIDMKDKGSLMAKELLFTTGSNGLSPQIKKSTRHSFREGKSKETLIDQIFTNSTLIVESKTLNMNVSDHLAVYVRRKKLRIPHKKVSFKGRSYRNFVKEDFQEGLININWAEYYKATNPNTCWQIMENAIRTALDESCPLKSFKVREIREPWVTDEILEEIKDKDNYIKIAKQTKKEEDWLLAKRERNRVGKLVKGAKADFVKEQQHEHKNDPKKFWKVVSSIVPGKKQKQMQGSISLRDEVEKEEVPEALVADHINNFFSNIGSNLASKVNQPWRFYGERVQHNCHELKTDYQEVLKLCKEINVTKSSGIEDIASKILKSAFLVLIPQLVYMFNLSFSTNLFPEKWKRATVIPLFKGGDRSAVGNYRPISLLPLPGKLLEKIAHKNITLFLETNNILTDKQSGFRKGFSTSSAVADLTDDLFSAVNKSEISLAVFADLRKAFDTVSHKILGQKIEKYGLRGNVQNWCLNYLSGRCQQTLANGVRSKQLNLSYGVPQGSVLGPLFFILYVNDIQGALEATNAHVQLYADDTVVYTVGQDLNVVKRDLQQSLNCLDEWCQSNKLTLNPGKTKLMSFGTRHAIKKTNQQALYLGGKKLQNVSTFKYLGFTLDSTLTFKSHLADVIRNVIHKKTLLARLKSFLHNDTALSIYKAIILPYFDYCDIVYQGANANDLDKLQRLQNKCLKICLAMHNLTDTNLVHSRAKCTRLKPRRESHLCNFMCMRCAKNRNIDERPINTRLHDAPVFKVDFPHKEMFKRSVKYAGAQVWNALPIKVRQIEDKAAFKVYQKKSLQNNIP